MSTTDAAAAMPPASKRAKVLPTGEPLPKEADAPVVPPLLSSADMQPLLQCLPLLLGAATDESGTQSADQNVLVPLPTSGPTGNSIHKMKELFDDHGFRTSLVTAPREGLSIYLDLDSAGTSTTSIANDAQEQQITPGKTILSALLGLHPDQNTIEQWFSTTVREVYCVKLFCQHVRSALGGSSSKDKVGKLLVALEDNIRSAVAIANAKEDAADLVSLGTDSPKAVASLLSATISNLQRLVSSIPKTMSSLIPEISEIEHNLRPDQLLREYESIRSQNSSYANALMQLFLDAHRCTIKEIQLRRSHLPKYERITVFLYDPNTDETRPPKFTFLPSLRRIIDDGVEAVVDVMVSSFWNRLLRLGYFATSDMKDGISSELRQYFLMGLAKDTSLPFLLNANFTPRYPLSFYLRGKAGVGKSSFVRFFAPALEAVIEELCDPEVACRFVKQNLNKKAQNLERELELRPNNNDLSVMSIIQGRRMTLTQQKPGLVVVGLEELASDEVEADPNQISTCQLISQRFSGRNSDYREGEGIAQPKNSTKRGISGDSSLIVIFTSNYDLCSSAHEALKRLDMFRNLNVLKTTPLSGNDREEFARSFIQHCVCDRLGDGKRGPCWDIDLNIPIGQGDIRTLVRELRILSLFVGKMLSVDVIRGITSSCVAKIIHDEKTELTIIDAGGQTVRLRRGIMGSNFYPVSDNEGANPYYDSRTDSAITEFRRLSQSECTSATSELGHVLDYYYTRALAPAVVVSNDAKFISNFVEAVSIQKGVNVISGIDPDDYKMIRSLYDPVGSPNLRDDIIKFGRGSLVVVELTCKSKNAQLLIREMIEDTPSRSAFSSNKSALEKDGILFAVHVAGELTPEIRSRASIIL